LGADLSKLFGVDFAHFVEGTSAAPDVPQLDSDYQAVLDYASSKGWMLPSSGVQALQNTLVLNLKSSGVWSKLYFLYVPATDSDQDFACINWKDPSDATNMQRISSPQFQLNQGFKGDGVAANLETPYSPFNLGWQGDNLSLFIYEFTNIDANDWIIGDETNINSAVAVDLRTLRNNLASGRLGSNLNIDLQAGLTSSIGFHHIYRDNLTQLKYKKDNQATRVINNTFIGFSDSQDAPGLRVLRRGAFLSNRGFSVFGGAQQLANEEDDLQAFVNDYINAL